jgi:DNA-binding NtrC family response regulator
VSATNRDLAERVGGGRFREDLLYRLNLITIRIPPLRERADDLPLLADHFLGLLADLYRRDPLTLTRAAVDWLRARSWPGNVRQLRQTLERAVLIQDGNRIDVDDLLAMHDLGSADESGTALPPAGAMTLQQMERAMIEKCLRHYDRNLSHVAEALGLSRPSLYRRLQKYGIDVDAS